MVEVPSPVDVIKVADGFCRIQAAIVKEKIPEKYLWGGLIGLGGTNMMLTPESTQFIGYKVFTTLKEEGVLPYVILSQLDVFGRVSDWVATLRYNENEKAKKNQSLDLIFTKCTNITKYLRLPEILAGAGFMSKGVYEVIANKNYAEGLLDFQGGLQFFLLGASMYIKDSDDEGLQRKREEAETRGLEKALIPIEK